MPPLTPRSTDWEQFQGDAGNTGYVPTSLHAPLLKSLWSKEEGNRGVAILGDDVFATVLSPEGTFSRGPYLLSRFDGETGSLLWQTKIRLNTSGDISSPVVAGDTVYVHRSGHSSGLDPTKYPALLGFDINTGEKRFATTHSGQWHNGGRPTVIGDQLFAEGGYYGGLNAYGLGGESQWFHHLNLQSGWIPAADENNVYVYMGEASASPGPPISSLYVVDRETGKRTATILHPSSDRALWGYLQNVILGGQQDAFAVTASTTRDGQRGRILVRFDLEAEQVSWEVVGNFSGNAALANGIIAIPDGDRLRVLDQETGEDLWSWSNGTEVSGNVILTEDYAFVNTEAGVNAIHLKGQQSVWSVEITGTLSLDDDLLVIANGEGIHAYQAEEYELSRENGSIIPWRDPATGELQVWQIGERQTVTPIEIHSAPSVSTQQQLESPQWNAIATADFNQDGHLDFIGHRDQQLRVWWMDNNIEQSTSLVKTAKDIAIHSAHIRHPHSKTWQLVTAADFNGDRQPDLLFRDRTSGALEVHYLEHSEQGLVREGSDRLGPVIADPHWQVSAAADFDQDGDTDLLWHHRLTRQMLLWLLDGVTPVQAQAIAPDAGRRNWAITGSGDFDGDGHIDLLWQHPTDGQAEVWQMQQGQRLGRYPLQGMTLV